jgi:undecaprenyl-diphosphatase
MSLLHAIVLGIVQGLTEFLPVSSKTHLVLVPFMAGWKQPTLAFIVAVHVGTLLSVTWVFRDRLLAILRTVVNRNGVERDRRLLVLLVIGTIPAVVIGAVFENAIDRSFGKPVLAATLLGVTAWVLFSAESHYERRENHRPDDSMTPADAGVIGVAQAVAVLPGISRSGTTISAGMWRGLTREAAMRFSFLLSIPIILGATIVKLPDLAREGASGSGGAIVIGVLASAATGVFAIRAMLGAVAKRGLRPFGVYCVLVMVAGLLTALARG